jgi:hypothetical protein
VTVTEISIALDRPALTPEVRAWINNHPGKRRPVLTRGHDAGLNRGTVLLRIDVDASSEADVQDEVESLLTDLRMLGLRPKLLDRDVA